MPLNLDTTSLDLAIRVTRLVFAHRTKWHAKRRLVIVGPDEVDDQRGITLVYAPLRVLPLEPCQRGKAGRRSCRARLHAGQALERAAGFHSAPAPFRVTCRLEAGFTLEIQGPVGWTPRRYPFQSFSVEGTLGSGQPLATLGLAVECVSEGLRLTTRTPEAILRFSACLARNEVLCLKLGPRSPEEARLFIQLRDFDGDFTGFPAATFPRDQGEHWLTGLPPLTMPIEISDAVSVARWAYPPDEWLIPDFRERLLTSASRVP
jgi:hypothetical protein